MKRSIFRAATASVVVALGASLLTAAPTVVKLDPSMLTQETPKGEPGGMIDEQGALAKTSPNGEAVTGWTVPGGPGSFPASAYLDLGSERYLASLWVYDTNGSGDLEISTGKPGEWNVQSVYKTEPYKKWVAIPLVTQSRYVRITRKDGASNIGEIVLLEQTEKEFAAAKAKAEVEAKALAVKQAADAKLAAEREAGVAKAKSEVANRQVVDLGDPFGKVTLVQEIDVAAANPGHLFSESPAGVSKVQNVLGKPVRVLTQTPGQCPEMTFRVGQYKLLKPGAAYILEVEYPEDAPRSMIVLNAGNESSQGFHTGETLGDVAHPKYVNNNNESIATPISGKFEKWQMFFNLHDRFVDKVYVRGDGERPLTPDDGFTVTIAQYSAENMPADAGAAVSKIRLYEIAEPEKLAAKYTLPPEGLPRRHLFWREEMADNVISAEKSGQAGVKDAIDWYKFKANQMQFLGMNTFTKDLLEFGAVQHWDSTAHGGNKWAYYNAKQAYLWGDIVKLMGERGFTVLPYYEYAGSKGQQGLGPERRAKPLKRDDAYTHIKWIESSNADITDPETYEDFKKMLDITVVQQKDNAKFVGAWLRPRSQIPVGFGDSTRKRFADEVNGGTEITRQQLREDDKLLGKYMQWWFGKRKQFLVAMRDYLRENGIDDASMMYTANASEPGVSFLTWDPTLVADNPAKWQERMKASKMEKEQKTRVYSIDEIIQSGLYKTALLSAQKNWGDWEVDHANPPPDPQDFKDVDGITMTYAFNRNYTVASPETMEAFRTPGGLAMLRYYSLNENMMYDAADKPKLGYFCSDTERAGPYVMMAEALAMANGDPRYIGYLRGRVFARGFPKYVRNFNTAFLSLPALPSTRLDKASADDTVVVREIKTPRNGTYYAIINTAMTDKQAVTVKLPAKGKVADAATGEAVEGSGGEIKLTLYPFQMRALRVE